MNAGWHVEHFHGTAGNFHGRPMPVDAPRSVWDFHPLAPALVLGSTQVAEHLSPDIDIDVVKRRSGGGAVLVVPDDLTWIDIILPRDDPHWSDDAGRAFLWLGEAWQAALDDLGFDAEIHSRPMVRTEWSSLVCFAGLGPGELTVDGMKVLGISQRRTRAGARFQCALLHAWDAAGIGGLLGVPVEDIADVAIGLDVDPAAVLPALLAHI